MMPEEFERHVRTVNTVERRTGKEQQVLDASLPQG
jgi:hypothetical protein